MKGMGDNGRLRFETESKYQCVIHASMVCAHLLS